MLLYQLRGVRRCLFSSAISVNQAEQYPVRRWGKGSRATLKALQLKHFAIVCLPSCGVLEPRALAARESSSAALKVCPDRLLLRTEYYNDWLRPLEGSHHLVRRSCVALARGPRASWCSSSRQTKGGAASFTAQEAGRMEKLCPGSAWSPSASPPFARRQVRARCSIGCVRCAPNGVIFLDGRDSPIRINRRAQTILDGADGLKLERGTLSASCSTDTAGLRRLIRQAETTTKRSTPVVE